MNARPTRTATLPTLVAALLLALGALTAPTRAQEPAPAPGPAGEVSLGVLVRPEGRAWVGQRVSVYVTVRIPGRPDESPRFDLPQVSGALLLKAPGSPVLGTEREGDVEFTTQRHELMLFPQRPGVVEVPSVGVRVRLGDEERTAATAPLSVEAALPEGAAAGALLVTTTRFTAEQTWDPAPADATVGDAFVRTITLAADDLLGLALPPAPAPEVPGLRTYVDDPVVDDRMNRGRLSSTRVDRTTFVCTAPGRVELPGVTYTWYDPDAGRLRTEELPGAAFEVAPDPTLAEPPGPGADDGVDPATLALVVGALLVAALPPFLMRRRLAAAWAARRARIAAAEPACFARLREACRRGDPAASWTALVSWMERALADAARSPPGHRAPPEPDGDAATGAAGHPSDPRATARAGRLSLVALDGARTLGGDELADPVAALERALVGAGGDARDDRWSGDALLRAVEHARRGLRAARAQRVEAEALPPLNPGRGTPGRGSPATLLITALAGALAAGLAGCGEPGVPWTSSTVSLEVGAGVVLPLGDDVVPVVEARLDGHPVRLLLDTGAEATILRDDLVETLGLPRLPLTHEVVSRRGAEVARTYEASSRVARLELGEAVAHDVSPLLADLPDFLLDIDGIVGMDVLGQAAVLFDAAAAEVRLLPSGTLGSSLAGVYEADGEIICWPWALEEGNRASVRLSFDGGVEFDVVVDTGAGICGFPGWAVDDLGLEAIGTYKSRHIGGADESELYSIKSLSFDEVVTGPLRVDREPDEDETGLLGYEALSQFVFVVDGPERSFCFSGELVRLADDEAPAEGGDGG